uniref:Uncharacterized protein n=1 Tax=Coccolithus braarudii TaxID=221442 RepID=A0A7S0PWY2_9EUKA
MGAGVGLRSGIVTEPSWQADLSRFSSGSHRERLLVGHQRSPNSNVKPMADVLRARAARFRAEARRPPPPLPKDRMAWTGGKIVTNSKDACLLKFIERKVAQGQELTADQQRALRALQPSCDADANTRANDATNVRTVPAVKRDAALSKRDAVQPAAQSKSTAAHACPEKRRLLKKLREVEALGQKRAAGERLEVNQETKLQSKSALLAQLAQLAGE